METLMILTYAAICIVIFKVFKIPLNKWTVPTAVLGGLFLIGSMLLLMNYNHPFSEAVRNYVPTTPIVPNVSGQVISVDTKQNISLQTGDVIFRIDPTPYELQLNSLDARLISATEDLKRAQSLKASGAGPERNVDLAQANVDDLTSQLALARYNLEQTIVRAPTNGHVAQLILHPGMRAVNMPLRPAAVFVHNQDAIYVAWFRQNNALRIEAGLEAEIALDSVPGKVFTAEVVEVASVMAEGQLQPSGNLVGTPIPLQRAGRVPVSLRITDPRFKDYAARIPPGSFGQAAVYSEHVTHIAAMRKMLLRMSSWLNYVFPFH